MIFVYRLHKTQMNIDTDVLFCSVQGDRLLKTLKFRFTGKKIQQLKKQLFGVFSWTVESSWDAVFKRAVYCRTSLNRFLMACVKIDPECKQEIMNYVEYKPEFKKDWRFIKKVEDFTGRERRMINTLLSIQDWKRFAMCCGYSFWDVKKWDSEKQLLERLQKDEKDLFDLIFVAKEMGFCTLFQCLRQIALDNIKR